MTTVAVSRLKARLSEYLSKVRAGNDVIVTDRGRPVARIVPYVSAGPTRERLEEMERAGLIRLPKKWPTPEYWKEFLALPRPKFKGSLLDALLEEREEGY